MSTETQEVKYPQSTFTFKDLVQMNPNVDAQNLRLQLKQAVDGGGVKKSDKVVSTGKRGRSPNVYIHS